MHIHVSLSGTSVSFGAALYLSNTRKPSTVKCRSYGLGRFSAGNISPIVAYMLVGNFQTSQRAPQIARIDARALWAHARKKSRAFKLHYALFFQNTSVFQSR